MPNINTILKEHVTFQCECIDRMFLNGYDPILELAGQAVNFMIKHRAKRLHRQPFLAELPRIMYPKQVCDELDVSTVRDFFDRWMAVLPQPLSEADREAGYRHHLSIFQFEMSLTQVFDRPLSGRQFFEEGFTY